MIPASFDYHRPASVAEALSLVAKYGDEGRVVAGGHSLIPMMKLRMANPQHLIDLRDVAELKAGIRDDGGTTLIGALVTQAELIADEMLARTCPILRETALQIADPQIRNCGTVGGNVANGDPGNDMPAVMIALDARFVVQGPDGTEELGARSFYQAAYFTALGDGRILTAIRIPRPPTGHGSAYVKQKRKIGDYATAAAAVLLTRSGDRCTFASIALTNVADTPLYAEEAARILVGSTLDAATIDRAVAAAEAITRPSSDGRGPARFRTKVASQMVRRAIAAASARASG
jgi:carbon-monoxide dehydrogenase medium subunit